MKDSLIDYDKELTEELHEFLKRNNSHPLGYMRKKHGYYEYGLQRSDGPVEWFPLSVAPSNVERYFRAKMKLDRI